MMGMKKLYLCRACSLGVHSGCHAKPERGFPSHAPQCKCPLCFPAEPLESTVLEALYTLAYTAYLARGSRDALEDEVWHAVRIQFNTSTVDQWTRSRDVFDAVWAQGVKEYYSRNEVTDALVAAGLDMEWANSTPATNEPPVTRSR